MEQGGEERPCLQRLKAEDPVDLSEVLHPLCYLVLEAEVLIQAA
jgi:hypothetical protein